MKYFLAISYCFDFYSFLKIYFYVVFWTHILKIKICEIVEFKVGIYICDFYFNFIIFSYFLFFIN